MNDDNGRFVAVGSLPAVELGLVVEDTAVWTAELWMVLWLWPRTDVVLPAAGDGSAES